MMETSLRRSCSRSLSLSSTCLVHHKYITSKKMAIRLLLLTTLGRYESRTDTEIIHSVYVGLGL